MKKKTLTKLITSFIVGIIIITVLVLVKNKDNVLIDSISYKDKTYICLEYNMDIFTYYHNSNNYYEEDMIHPISHNKWDMVYFNGDLFILDSEVEKAKKYYANDKNYEWFVAFDEDEEQKIVPISITKEELEYLYNMENSQKKETILFEEIEKFSSIIKISKDKTVYSLITLAYCRESWYWKTEIMNDADEEYVIKLPNSLNQKINKLLNK